MTLLIAVFLALVLFFGQRKLFDKNWKRKLQVSLAFGEQGVYPGELCTLKQIIQNKKRMPLPALQVKFQADKSLQFQDETEAVVTDHYYRSEVFMVGGRKQITRTLPFRPQCRKIFDRADSNSCTGFFYEQKICGRLAGKHDDLCISKTVIHEAVIEPQ